MDYFLGSVKLMLIIYALAAVISMLAAWVIKLIFAAIRSRPVPAAAAKTSNSSPSKAP
ncbi:MAG: hypothetical protein HY847_13725 [Betaproteobacteria bacterium]|nr:hypothetical protein [Betaproteobacteria bacterium]